MPFQCFCLHLFEWKNVHLWGLWITAPFITHSCNKYQGHCNGNTNMCTLKKGSDMSTGLYTITRILAYHKILMCIPVTWFYLWGKTPIMARWRAIVDPRQRHKIRSRGSQYDVVSRLNQWDPLYRNFTGLSLSSKKQWVVNNMGCGGRHLLAGGW